MLTLRPAGPPDFAFFNRASAELAVDDPVSPEKWAREIEPHTTIAEDCGAPRGYAFAHALGEVGHLKHIVTLPDARRQGVARALMAATAAKLRAEGCTEWVLNVKVENTAAKRLYAQHGMRFSYASSVLRLEWSKALGFPTADVHPVDPGESDDAGIEQTFKLLDGLVRERRHLGRVIRAVADQDSWVGVAVFDPTFPGAFPFQARSLPIAGTLLRALHEKRRPGDLLVNLVVERDSSLIDALIEAGAEARIRMENWRGSLTRARCPVTG